MCNPSQGYYGSNSELSPVTQDVLSAIKQKWKANQDTLIRELSATAIRAAADNVVFSNELGLTAYGSFSQLQSQLHQIASELENLDNNNQ